MAAAAGIALVATLATAQQRPPGGGRERMAAAPNPSAIVSAELAFARLARERGQWTAFRETAEDDAIMFLPDTVNAQAWLRKRPDPAQAVAWSPRAVYVSCDGGYGVSTGPWTQADGSTGTFTTIWRRQRKGSFKWILDFGSDQPFAAASNDDLLIDGKVADCPARGGPDRVRNNERLPVVPIPNPPPASGEGQSNDGTLRWRWTNGPDGRTLDVMMRYQGEERQVIRESVAAAPAP